MSTIDRPTVLGFLLLFLGSAAADADGMVAITITNDNTNDILVTVRDMNMAEHTKIFEGQRISGFTSVPISIIAGADGTGHVWWRATTAGGNGHKCGHKDRPGLGNNDSVHVYAHSTCPVRARPTDGQADGSDVSRSRLYSSIRSLQ